MVILPVLGVPLVSFVEIIAGFVSLGIAVPSTIKSVPLNVVFSLKICGVENMVVTTDVVAGEFLPVDVDVPSLDVLAPADAVDVIFCCGLSEDELIFVEPSTLEILFDVLLEAGLPEDVVILPDTDAVVSNVVVWNVEPVLLTDSVSVLAVDGEVIFTNFLSDVDTLFDEVALVLLDSVLSSKLMSVAV